MSFAIKANKMKITSHDHFYVFGLTRKEHLTLVGLVQLRVYSGSLSVFGYTLGTGDYVPVHSPVWSSSIVLWPGRKVENAKNYEIPDGDYRNEEYDAERLARYMAKEYPVVIICKPITIGFSNIDCYVHGDVADGKNPGFKFRLDENKMKEGLELADRSEDLAVEDVRRLFLTSEKQVMDTKEWDACKESIVEGGKDSSIMICGGKGVGKSAFGRFLMNALLSKNPVVAYLDTDVGQPEFTPPGMLSLHFLTKPEIGPSHTHMKTPYRGYAFGYSTPKSNPVLYTNLVQKLMEEFKKVGLSVPLIVNTDGWIKSMGYDTLCTSIHSVQPSHVVQLQGLTRAKCFDLPKGPWISTSINSWTSVILVPAKSSSVLQLYRLQAYFLEHEPLCGDKSRSIIPFLAKDGVRISSYVASMLTRIVPRELPVAQCDIEVNGYNVPKEDVEAIITTSIIALCIQRTQDDLHENTSLPHCIGYAIVRHVWNGILYLITPVAAEALLHVNYIRKTQIAVPASFLKQDSPLESPYMCMNNLSSDAGCTNVMQSRNGIKRKKGT